MKQNQITLQTFKIFVDLAETKNFSKTADRNFLTQSAISQQLTLLEKNFKNRLVNRAKGWFRLTQEGDIFLKGAQKILREYQCLLDAMYRSPTELSGVLRVQTIYSIGLHFLNKPLKSFMQTYPGIEIQLEYHRYNEIYSNVLSGECDLGIVAYASTQSNLEILKLDNEDQLIFVCHPLHSLANKNVISIRSLRGQDFIGFQQDIPTYGGISKILNKYQVDVRYRHQFDNVEIIKRSIEVGSGVSILPRSTLTPELKANTLSCSKIKEGPFFRPIALIYRKGLLFSTSQKRFVNWLIRGQSTESTVTLEKKSTAVIS